MDVHEDAAVNHVTREPGGSRTVARDRRRRSGEQRERDVAQDSPASNRRRLRDQCGG
jgi:hypothetical protein